MSIPISIDPMGTLGSKACPYEPPAGYKFVPSVYFDGGATLKSSVDASTECSLSLECDLYELDTERMLLGAYSPGRFGFTVGANALGFHFYGAQSLDLSPPLVGGRTVIVAVYGLKRSTVKVVDANGERNLIFTGTAPAANRPFYIGGRNWPGTRDGIMTFYSMRLDVGGKTYIYMPCKNISSESYHICVAEPGGTAQVCEQITGSLKASRQ